MLPPSSHLYLSASGHQEPLRQWLPL
jgi:hypothetical protein